MSKETKYLDITVRMFYKEDTDTISLLLNPDQDQMWSSINNRPGSLRYHRNLYAKLNHLLAVHGKPHGVAVDEKVPKEHKIVGKSMSLFGKKRK